MSTTKASSTEPSARVTELRDVLRAAGLRTTMPRMAVYTQLQGARGPVSHGEVAEALEPQGIDRATVYRILIDLCDAGLAQRTDSGDHLWRFELESKRDKHHDAGAHAHFTCTDCGTVECLPKAVLQLTKQPKVPRAVAQKRVEIQVKGVCDACAT